MKVDESGQTSIKLDLSERKFIVLDERGCKWEKMDESC